MARGVVKLGLPVRTVVPVRGDNHLFIAATCSTQVLSEPEVSFSSSFAAASGDRRCGVGFFYAFGGTELNMRMTEMNRI